MSKQESSARHGEWWKESDIYRQLVNTVDDYAIIMLDAEGIVRTWNPGAEKTKGYTADEIVGRHFSVFYPQESLDAQLPQREIRVATETGRYEDEGWRVRKDGTRFWANVVISALRGEDGSLLGFAKITRDLTGRREREHELRRSTAYARALIETAPVAVLAISPENVVTDANTAAERLLGRGRGQLVGSDFSGYFAAPGIARTGFERVFRQERVSEYSLELVRVDGSTTPTLFDGAVYRDEDGTTLGACVILNDVTEQKLAERRIQEQNEAILELSTPVMQIWDGIVVVPLIGSLDSQRTQMFMERLLERIVETNSPMALVDIMGVPTVDTQTAQHLIETISAVRLLGAQVVLTGVRPVIAQTLVRLGVDLSGIQTRSSLSAGLKVALDALSLHVVSRDADSSEPRGVPSV
jgi:PAS domain S-box-containing protein